MKVTFTRIRTGRAASPLASDDAYLPRDLAQFVIEEYFEIRHGAIGQLTATPAPRARTAREQRTARRSAEANRSDISRSDRLVAMCLPLWHAKAGRMPATPAVIDMTLATPFDVDRVLHLFDEASASWRALAPGQSLAMEWREPVLV
jgi:hypothetical protein